MKIVQVIESFGLGGAEQVSINIAIGLAKKGHDCCVVAVTKPSKQSDIGDEMKARLQNHNVSFYEFGGPNRRLNALFFPFRLRRFLRKWKPDIIHSHTDVPDFMVSLATKFSNFRKARTIHNWVLWPTHTVMGWVCESGFRDDLIVLISEGTREAYGQLRAKYWLPASRHQVKIVNGISINSNSSSIGHSDLIKQIRAEKDKVLFCFAGRFTHQKGFDVLLDSLEIMPEIYRNKIKIHAFGDGEDREIYSKRIKENRFPVTIHPATVGVWEIFPEFDAVIMPSRYEGFGLVLVEALVNGVPVIGTSAPGLNETYPPDWPLKVPIENSKALSDLIIKFADSNFNVEELKTIGKTWGEKFTISRMVDAYEKAFLDYLDTSKGDGG